MIEANNQDNLVEDISQDVNELMDKILSRLNSQSDIIIVATKLRVIRLFIDQIAEGGNKVFLTDEFKKIKDKIKLIE